MLNAKVKDLLNQQVNKEFYSAYLYLDFSNYFEARGLDGFANWYKIQAQEERDHALLFYQYLHNNNEAVTLDAIAKPDKVLDSDMTVLKAGLEHEEYVTSLINDIYAAAYEVKDFRTMQFLDWFVKEQGEEEKNAQVDHKAGNEDGLLQAPLFLRRSVGCICPPDPQPAKPGDNGGCQQQ